MKKLFVSFAIVLLLITCVIAASIAMTDYDKLYQGFIKSTRADVSNLKTGSFKVHKLPMPYLVIDEIAEDSKFNLKNIEVRFSLASLIRFDPKITSVNIGDAIVHLAHDDVNFLSHDEFISELIAKDMLSVEAHISRLKFVESDNDVPLVIDNFDFIASDSHMNFTGVVDGIGSLVGSFVKAKEDMLFKLNVKRAGYNLNLEENYKNAKLEKGKAQIKTTALSDNLERIFPDIKGIDSNEEVTISFDIEPVKQWMAFKNIVVDSESLKGSGEISLSKNNHDLSDVKLEFSKIDLNSWKNSGNNKVSVDKSLRYSANKRFDFKNNHMKINIFAKDVQLDADNFLENVNIKLAIDDDKLNVHDFSGSADKDGSFKVTGYVSQNSFRSLFKGKIYLQHKDLNDLAEFIAGKDVRTSAPIPFSMFSELKMSSVDLSLRNFVIKTNVADLTGSISTKFIGNSPRTNANLHFSSIDVDTKEFPMLPQAFDYAASLLEGAKKDDYLAKFAPIRKINSIGNYDISFDRLIANKKLYEKVSFVLSLAPGRVAVEQLFIKDGKDWLDTSIVLSAESLRPSIDWTIHNGSIKFAYISAPGLMRLRSNIMDNWDLNKIDAKMRFSIRRLYQDNFALERLRFVAKNQKNLFDITQFDANLLGGRLQSSGSILLDPYTVNFVYALNSASIDKIAKLLPPKMLNIGGFLSASGMLTTNGDKLDEQLYNLYTKSNLVTKNITLGNFSIDEFVQKIGVANYNTQGFKYDVKKAMLTGETKISDLKTEVRLSKGIFNLPSIAFKTKYTAGSGAAKFNIYDFTVNSSTIFSFYLAKPKYGRSVTDYAASTMKVNATDLVFSPKKEAETKELEEALVARSKN